jgi:hypothetical protein
MSPRVLDKTLEGAESSGGDREADTFAFLSPGRTNGKPKEVSGSTVTCAPGPRTISAKMSRASRCPHWEGEGRPGNLRRGCSGRESGTPRLEVETLERDPDVTRICLRACPKGPREAKGDEAHERRRHA